MLIFLLIYVPGIIATLWVLYRNLHSGARVVLSDLLLAIFMSLFSWIAFILVVIVIYGNTTVFEKK